MNSLLNLPTDHMLVNIAGILLCVAIAIASVCRINLSEARRWRISLEQAMLLCFALWSAGTMADLAHGRNIGWHGAAAGLGIALYLVLSFRQWRLQEALRGEMRAREVMRRRAMLHVHVEEPPHGHSLHH